MGFARYGSAISCEREGSGYHGGEEVGGYIVYIYIIVGRNSIRYLTVHPHRDR